MRERSARRRPRLASQEAMRVAGDHQFLVGRDRPGRHAAGRHADARAGVGSPGYPPECYITEIKVDGEFVDAVNTDFSEAQLEELESKLMDIIDQREAAEQEERAEAEYRAWKESRCEE